MPNFVILTLSYLGPSGQEVESRGVWATAASWHSSLRQACCGRDGPSGFSANIWTIQTTKVCYKPPEMKTPSCVVSPMSSAPQRCFLGEHKFFTSLGSSDLFSLPCGGNCSRLLWKLVCISAGVLPCFWCSPCASWGDRINFKLHLLLSWWSDWFFFKFVWNKWLPLTVRLLKPAVFEFLLDSKNENL